MLCFDNQKQYEKHRCGTQKNTKITLGIFFFLPEIFHIQENIHASYYKSEECKQHPQKHKARAINTQSGCKANEQR